MVERQLLHYIIALYPQYARRAFNEMLPEYADDDEDKNVVDKDEDDENVDNDSL